MVKSLAWLLAVAVAIISTLLTTAAPQAPVLTSAGPACTGNVHCDGPPAVAASDQPRPPATPPPALLAAPTTRSQAAFQQRPTILTPRDLTRGPGLGSVLDTGGRAFNIVGRLAMVASEYTTGEPGVGRVTYTGTRARLGEVAVDPRVLPLGTWMYVTGYHSPDLPPQGIVEHAEDIGGLIKGDRVDIYVHAPFSHLADFGLQPVTVYILEPRTPATDGLPLGRPR